MGLVTTGVCDCCATAIPISDLTKCARVSVPSRPDDLLCVSNGCTAEYVTRMADLHKAFIGQHVDRTAAHPSGVISG